MPTLRRKRALVAAALLMFTCLHPASLCTASASSLEGAFSVWCSSWELTRGVAVGLGTCPLLAHHPSCVGARHVEGRSRKPIRRRPAEVCLNSFPSAGKLIAHHDRRRFGEQEKEPEDRGASQPSAASSLMGRQTVGFQRTTRVRTAAFPQLWTCRFPSSRARRREKDSNS